MCFTTDRYGRYVMAKWHETRIGRFVCECVLTVVVVGTMFVLMMLASDTLPVVLP